MSIKNVRPSLKSAMPSALETNCTRPVVLVMDSLDSERDQSQQIFNKLSFLGNTILGSSYRRGLKICLALVGDSCGREKFQVQDFTNQPDLSEKVKSFSVDFSKGESSDFNDYGLAALYFTRNVKMSRAKKPILIFVADKSPRETVPRGLASFSHINLSVDVKITKAIKQLKEKYEVYVILKPTDRAPYSEAMNQNKWEKLVGLDHLCQLTSMYRAADVIMGILAKEYGTVEEFHNNLISRQAEGTVKEVYKSLSEIHSDFYNKGVLLQLRK